MYKMFSFTSAFLRSIITVVDNHILCGKNLSMEEKLIKHNNIIDVYYLESYINYTYV